MYLERINAENDIKKLPEETYPFLAQEIREFLIQSLSVTGGHLGSNLGSVELTMALHLELDLPKDKIVWDVGHQSYTHKLLTGRREGFAHLRQYGGLSGFPKRRESACDAFDTGHSSTSISAGLGLRTARDLRGGTETIVSVIGDGALTGGMAYEALNNAGSRDSNFIIILNDNNMSISENVGGVPTYLEKIRTSSGYVHLKADVYEKLVGTRHGETMVEKIRRAKNSFKSLMSPGMMFEDMGILYLGPVDGHDVDALREAIRAAKRMDRTVLIHVNTQKGKGFLPAERHPARFHGAEPFDIETGIPSNPRNIPNWTDIFSTVMFKLGARNEKVCAITAAMAEGTGLKRFSYRYPDRFFDVGIAEEHAVTFAAGLAAGGMRPVVAIYSSFLQRAYDQILHDVCIQNLPVVFAVDRAGIVGSDGETHQGIFDLSYLCSIPNLTVMSPKNKWELSDMMKFALKQDGPVAIRYPRGAAYDGLEDFRAPMEMGKSEVIVREGGIALFALGSMVPIAEKVRENLMEKGYDVSLINARFAAPLDAELLCDLSADHKLLVTLEENVHSGGFGERVLDLLNEKGSDLKLLNISIPDRFVEHGSVDILRKELKLDADSVTERVLDKLSESL